MKKYLVVIVFLLALILRVWKITEYPAGLNADEAAIGYNAYSLLKTGKDEFGHSWPMTFQSFNDFKPGIYFYLVLPFVKLLGLNELAVRLPSVILGTITVLILYLLVKELFDSESLAISSMLLLTISPWHLHFSRGGWETNTATFFIVTGTYFLMKALKAPKFYFLSSLFYLLSLYTYHSARVIVPLLIFGLVILYRKEILRKSNFRWIFLTIGVGVFLTLPLVFSFLGSAGVSRFSGVGIFADTGPIWRVNELRGQHQNPYSLSSKLLHNKVFAYEIAILENYFSHFSGDFLFINGDEIQRNKIPEMGQLYLIEIVFLPLGIYFFLKNRPKNWEVPFIWLAVAPIASSLTFQSPHALRALNMVIPIMIINSYGLVNLLSWVRSKLTIILSSLFIILFFLFYFWSLTDYLHQYYVHYPQRYPAAWEYGFKELVNYIKSNEKKYTKIYVTNKYDQPYILFAFYLQYPPEKFQEEAKLTPRDKYGFSTVDNFDKYYFGPIDWQAIKSQNKTLVVGSPEEIPQDARVVAKFFFKDGLTEAFRIAEL